MCERLNSIGKQDHEGDDHENCKNFRCFTIVAFMKSKKVLAIHEWIRGWLQGGALHLKQDSNQSETHLVTITAVSSLGFFLRRFMDLDDAGVAHDLACRSGQSIMLGFL